MSVRERIGPVGVWLGALGRASAAKEREAAAEIEELGYPALWISETSAGKEAMAHAGLLLAATSRLIVATGIANVYARDATAAATGAAALAEAYPGRFLLGIGVSHAPAVASRGQDYGRPLSTMRAYLDAMDAAGYDAPPPPEPAPLVLAALRPRMLELAAQRTDGAHPYFVPVAHTARAREILGAGPLLAPEQAVLLEEDPGRARAQAHAHLRYYLRLPNYVNNLRDLGYGDEDVSGDGSDRLADDIVGWGSVDAVVERVRAQHAAGADHVAIQPLADDIDGALVQLRELAGPLLA